MAQTGPNICCHLKSALEGEAVHPALGLVVELADSKHVHHLKSRADIGDFLRSFTM